MQTFLGFANFYPIFLQGDGKGVAPLTALSKNGIKFEWSSTAEDTFQVLNTPFTNAPMLLHFDLEKLILMKPDYPHYVSASVLSQYDDKGTVHPATFYSKNHSLRHATMRSMTRNYWS